MAAAKKVVVKKTIQKTTVKKPVKTKIKMVSAIPKGYHSITPYLIVNNALKAIQFYKKVFAAKLISSMERDKKKIGHAELKIGDSYIMLADDFPEMGANNPNHYGGSPVSLHHYCKDVDSVFKLAVKAGAKVERTPEDMFYGDRCAGIVDPYGHTWYIATHIEDVTPAKMKKRMAEMASAKPKKKTAK